MTERRQVLMLVSCVLIALVTLAGGASSAASKPTRRTVVVPARTALDVRLATPVASVPTGPDDPVLASLATPVIVDGVNVAPAASVLMGTVSVANESVNDDAARELSLRFDRLRVGATTYDIRTSPVRIVSERPSSRDGVRVSSGTRLRLELLAPVSIDVHPRR